jgi:hypothetical protein
MYFYLIIHIQFIGYIQSVYFMDGLRDIQRYFLLFVTVGKPRSKCDFTVYTELRGLFSLFEQVLPLE